MSIDLIAVLVAIVAIIATCIFEVRVLHQISTKMDTDDAALYLQGRKIQEILREMRQDLLRTP